MTVFSTTPLTHKQIWQNTFDLYRRSFVSIWPLLLLIVATLFPTYVFSFELKNFSHIISNAQKINIIFLTISMMLSVYLANIMLHRIYLVGKNEVKSIEDSFKFVLSKFFPLLVATFITFLVIILGILCLILPGMFLFIALLFVQSYILFDNKKTFGAIKDSCKLVWKDWWITFLRFLPLLVIDLLFSGLMGHFGKISFTMSTISNIVFYCFYTPIFYSLILVSFYDLKARKAIVVVKG